MGGQGGIGAVEGEGVERGAGQRRHVRHGDEGLVDVGARPAAGVQLEGGLAILGDGDAREAARLVERRPAPNDRRGVLVRLTEA